MGERYVLTTNTREKCQMMPQKEISPEQGSPHIALVWVQILKEQLFAGGLPQTPHDALSVLRDRVYRFGAKYAPSDFLRRLTGTAVPDSAPFLRYLREKHLGEAK